MDEPQGLYAQWNKLDPKGQILQDFIHMKHLSKIVNVKETERRKVVGYQRLGEESRRKYVFSQFPFYRAKKNLKICCIQYKYSYYWTVHLKMVKMVNLMLCFVLPQKKLATIYGGGGWTTTWTGPIWLWLLDQLEMMFKHLRKNMYIY